MPQPFLLLNVTRALLIQLNNPRVGKLSFSCTWYFIQPGFRSNKTGRETPLRAPTDSLFFCCEFFESRVGPQHVLNSWSLFFCQKVLHKQTDEARMGWKCYAQFNKEKLGKWVDEPEGRNLLPKSSARQIGVIVLHSSFASDTTRS